MNLFTELKQRNVFRVAAAYIVTAWLVIQVVETILPAFGFGDVAVRYVTIAFAVGLVPVLVLSWVFEWTPEGLKREAEVDDSAAASLAAARRLDRLILIVLALALGYFAFDKFVLAPEQVAREVAEARQEGRSQALVESYGEQSIAVLAFEDMSPDKDQEYLSDGIAEEILSLLTEIPELRVISRTSAFSFKGKDVPIPEIARQLNVAHILEGSVRKSGDRIRITAQLIEARSDTHIWSETYDRTLDDVFAIQDELAAAMVNELQLSLMGDMPYSRRVDPEAYLLYLEGHRLVAYVDDDRAVLVLEKAVEIEPEFADAWADLSRAYWHMSATADQLDHEGDENWVKSWEAYDRLVEIDPDHPSVMATEAWEAVEKEYDFAKAARLLERGIELHPYNWDIALSAIVYSYWTRRDDVAVALARCFVARDPLCTDCSYWYARAALVAGHYHEAEREILRFRSLVPGAGGEMTLGSARLLAGDIPGAQAALRVPEEALREDPDHDRFLELSGELMVQLASGDRTDFREKITELEALVENKPYRQSALAGVYALAGDKDAAFHWLNRLAETSPKRIIASETRSPFLQSLHDDPRWLELLEYAGVAPHQLAGIEFNPKLPNLGSK